MGVMFPAIKALGAGLVDKLMYLTAKTVTAKVAVDAYKRLEKNGLNLRTVCISAKTKSVLWIKETVTLKNVQEQISIIYEQGSV